MVMDEASGLQMYTNSIDLNFIEKLQLRIITERGLDVHSLKGDEFQNIKDYAKLEQRKAMLNNLDDFFDPASDQGPEEDKENVFTGNHSVNPPALAPGSHQGLGRLPLGQVDM